MAVPKRPPLALPLYAAAPPVRGAERVVAQLFDGKGPTGDELRLAEDTRYQLTEIVFAGAKTKVGVNELMSVVTHTGRVFQQGTAELYGMLAGPFVNEEHASVCQQFTGICVLTANRVLQGAMNYGTDAIGEIIAQPIEKRPPLLVRVLSRR